MLKLAVILFAIAITTVIFLNAEGAVDNNGNIVQEHKPELKLDCLLFSDGKLAIVEYSSRHGCGTESGAMNTISYLLKKGYHIDSVVPTADQGNLMVDMGVVFMSR